ncbi:MAG: Fpg/Nei family DNA glycosylase [Longimicrobiaceae bacterium]
MPELPDVEVYIEAIERRIAGEPLTGIRLGNPFVLRSVDPPPAELAGRRVESVRRLGKRIVIGLEGGYFIVVHLMIAGRFRWLAAGAKLPGKLGLAAFDFPRGSLVLTEAGSKRRASIHLVRGDEALAAMDPGGIDVMAADVEAFAAALTRERHTLKRTLTDPKVFSGIGNAYSDEILHRARMSPFVLSQKLRDEEIGRLFAATKEVLREWVDRLRAEAGDGFPEKVTAFRPDMAVHGKFKQPCPVCGAPVQRIRYADNETNYCPGCQTDGRILADRSLSRLLRDDWPKHLDDL